MTAKEYLGQAYRLDQRINSKLEILSSMKEMITRTTSLMSDDVVSSTRNVHKLEDAVAKIIDMQNEINDDIDQLIDLKRDVTTLISMIKDPSCQIVLELRYLSYRSWEEIAADMRISIRSVYRLHGQGLRAVDQILHKKLNNWQ